jgi:cadmium resistance protein CadD (predicted permease)
VSSLPASIGTAVALFAATNVDDVVVLTLLSASSRAGGRSGGRLRRWEIWAGQYAGFAVLVGLSLAAGRGLSLVPARWLWLLALIPFTVGAVTLAAAIRAVHRGEEPQAPSAGGLLGVAAITIVDGADNVAAYTPVFATSGGGQIAVTLVVFAVGIALWCAAGSLLVRHHRITGTLARYGHWILPVAFILIGLYVLYETGAFGHL